MTSRNLNLPEPFLPEHDLIRSAAPMPELSPGFRNRVLDECSAGILHARRVFRVKVGAAVVAVCCLVVLCAVLLPTENSAPQPVAEESVSPTTPNSHSPGGSIGLPSSSGLAVDEARPSSNGDTDRSQMNELIEELKGRQQIFNAGMLPRL